MKIMRYRCIYLVPVLAAGLLCALNVAAQSPSPPANSTASTAQVIATYKVMHDHRIGQAPGELVFTMDGFTYTGGTADEAKHNQSWRDGDLKRIEIRQREIRLTAYEAARYPLIPRQVPYSKGGKDLRLGSEREHVFQLSEGEITPEIVSMLLARFPRPVMSSVVPAVDTAQNPLLFEIPVFHRQRTGGSSGTLRVYREYVIFDADAPDESRFWRYADLRDIGQLGRYGLELATYEKQFASDGKSYVFDLKRPLTPAEYDKLWAQVYDGGRKTQP